MNNTWLNLLRHLGRTPLLPLGLRYRLISKLVPESQRLDFPFQVDFYGMKYDGNLKSFIDWNTYFFGAFTAKSLAFQQKLFNKLKPKVILDIGGNVGHHALFYASTKAQTHTFEPILTLYQQIQHKIQANNLSHLSAYNIALGEEDREDSIFLPYDYNQGTGTILEGHAASKERTQKITIRKGDSIIKELGLATIDYIKIDVEGYELKVLQGLSESISQYKPVIFMEYVKRVHNMLNEEKQTLQDYLPKDYSYFYIETSPLQSAASAKPYTLGEARFGDLLFVPKEKLHLLS